MNQTTSNDTDENDAENNLNDDVTINLVKSIFKDVAEFSGITDEIPKVLAKLYDSYLSIALTTPNLFAIENHQARLFLIGACQISIDWDQSIDSNNSYLKKLESIVENIIDADVYESKVFVTYQDDLKKVLTRLKKRQEIIQKRLREKTLGQEKIKQAQDYTNQLISKKISKENVPAFVKNIFIGEWTNVLVLLHIRHGHDSVEYQSKLEFVNLLMICLQLDCIKDSAQEKISILKKTYQEGLELVAFNQQEIPAKIKKLFDNLTRLHQSKSISKVLETESVPLNPPVKKKQKTIKQVPTVSIEAKPINVVEKTNNSIDYTQIVAALETGTWFEFINQDKSSTKAKLSWISPITGNLLFVDSRGLKLTDKTREGLEEDLKNKMVTIMKTV